MSFADPAANPVAAISPEPDAFASLISLLGGHFDPQDSLAALDSLTSDGAAAAVAGGIA